MNRMDRRQWLQAGGALLVSFSWPGTAPGQTPAPGPAGPARDQELDSWLAVAGDGRVTAYCGKVELGTGI